MAKRRGGRAPASLAGTHMHRDTRTGIYVWKRVDPTTGSPRKRSTGTTVLHEAMAAAARFEDEHRLKAAGISIVPAGWRRELLPLVEEWLEAKTSEGRTGAQTISDNRRDARRALDALGLRTCGDLTDVARIDRRARALEGPDVSRATVRRVYQDTLKMLSAWLAGNQRVLDRDPLATWEPIAYDRSPSGRPALEPDVLARAIVAAGWLDVLYGRRHGTRLVFVVLLVTAARVTSLLERQVEHFLADAKRIDFGEGTGRKRRGRGMLGAVTTDELAAAIGSRATGPLLLSPDGARLTRERLLDSWKESVGLGAVLELWPEGEAWAVDVAHQVNQVLLKGRPQDKGGNPRLVLATTLQARRDFEARVLAIAAQLRAAWTKRTTDVDLHGLRTVHRTWAVRRDVPEFLIDLQLGHAVGTTEGLERSLAASAIGRKHYTDARLLDVGRSAEAVRATLDEALGRVARLPGGSAGNVPHDIPHASGEAS